MLASLAPQVLSALLTFLEGRDIGRLWLSGSTQLNYRLAGSDGVKSFRFVSNSLFPTVWPSLVRHFAHLEELWIGAESMSVGHWREWEPRFSELSPSLRTLRLQTLNDFEALVELLRTEENAFPRLQHLSGYSSGRLAPHIQKCFDEAHKRLSNLITFDFPFLALNDTKHWSQQLQKLNLNDFRFGIETTLPICLEELHLRMNSLPRVLALIDTGLPPNLHTLEIMLIYDDSIYIPGDRFIKLPRGLKRLIIPSRKTVTSQDLKTLPPLLTELDLELDDPLEPDLFQWLPRPLQKFTSLPQPTPETIKLFPPNLTTMELKMHIPAIYAGLPSKMRSIVLPVRRGNSQREMRVIGDWPRLPDTIMHLEGLDSRYLETHELSTHLRVLKLGNQELEEQALKTISKSKIDHLVIYACSFDLKCLVEYLPPQMTRLEILQSKFDMEASDGAKLPRTLRHLSLAQVALKAPQPLAHLPLDLEYLGISSHTYDDGCLEFGKFEKLKTLLVNVYSFPQSLPRLLFAQLPRKLTEFSFSFPRDLEMDMSDQDLYHLPPGLVMIRTGKAPGILGHCKSRLPKDMHTCNFGGTEILNSLALSPDEDDEAWDD